MNTVPEKHPITPTLDVVIMAAGKGTRMKSKLPKVLHLLAGRALLRHVMTTALELAARQVIVITGHGAAEVEANCRAWAGSKPEFALNFAHQQPQLGTGHAVQQALVLLHDEGVVLILSGDVPLTSAQTLQRLVALSAGKNLALLTIELPDPSGYGRIVRRGDEVAEIAEQKDASSEQLALHEIYGGIMALPARQLPDGHCEVCCGRQGASAGAQDQRSSAGCGCQQPAATGTVGTGISGSRGGAIDGARRSPGGPGAARCAR